MDRTPGPVFHGGHAASSSHEHGMLAGNRACHSGLPGLLEEIQKAHTEGDRPETQGEKCKSRKKFANSVELESGKDTQKQPHPFATTIFRAHHLNSSLIPQDPLTESRGQQERAPSALARGASSSTCPIRQV